jgi:hypothetical protein
MCACVKGSRVSPALSEFNPEALAALEGMGFPLIRAQRALLATGNTADADVAMEWLFSHLEDPGMSSRLKRGRAYADGDHWCTQISTIPCPLQVDHQRLLIQNHLKRQYR